MRFKVVFTTVSLILWLSLYCSLHVEYTSFLGRTSSIFLMVQSLWLVVRSGIKKNILYTIFFVFIFLYTVPSKLLFFDGVYLSAYNQVFTNLTATLTTLIFALFLIVVGFFVKIPCTNEMQRMVFKSNTFIFIVLYIIAFIIVLTSKRSGNMYDNSGDIAEVSTLNEYVIILFLILYVYSGNKLCNLLWLTGLYAMYIIFAILNGGRIEVVLLLLLLLNVRFQYTVPFKKMIIIFILGVWCMSVFGSIRHNPQLLLSGDIMSFINPFAPKEYLMNCQGSNEGDVYWASERMLILINKGELTIGERFEAGVSYFLSALIPTSALSPLANLSSYKVSVEGTGGGGLAPIFFYAMFGFSGVILLGYFIAKVLNQLSGNISTVWYIYIVLMITMVARWFAYYPIHLIKLCLWGVLAYYLVNCFDYTMKKCRS